MRLELAALRRALARSRHPRGAAPHARGVATGHARDTTSTATIRSPHSPGAVGLP